MWDIQLHVLRDSCNPFAEAVLNRRSATGFTVSLNAHYGQETFVQVAPNYMVVVWAVLVWKNQAKRRGNELQVGYSNACPSDSV